MAVGDRKVNPASEGYATYEITDETVVGGQKQAALIVKQVDDTGATVTPTAGGATAAKQDTGNTSLSSIDGKLTTPLKGAANLANGQATAGAASGVLVASRATRRSVIVRNLDAANSAYIGTGTVTAGNGFLLKAGESIAIDSVVALNCIRATADVALAYMESYD